ncbi:hypothetical protein BVC80_1791g68 [Macleaya cordata]|uniref:Uncharacterized protein n=1 Tax=Macleaya cordata TaxID=56857 RepID=A0A200QPU5_MACCD|nr:hypothetical protein BVC80_1791g68 [Macleaya cordata]
MMPKNNTNNNRSRSKSSARKPLVDISNGRGKLSKPSSTNKKKLSEKEEEEEQVENDEVLDRLLLSHSDLSNLIHQRTMKC